MKYELSEHARDMMKERGIDEAWAELTIQKPEKKETRDDGTVHYIRAVEEADGRFLRVVVNPDSDPPRVVTLFFDRRLERKS